VVAAHGPACILALNWLLEVEVLAVLTAPLALELPPGQVLDSLLCGLSPLPPQQGPVQRPIFSIPAQIPLPPALAIAPAPLRRRGLPRLPILGLRRRGTSRRADLQARVGGAVVGAEGHCRRTVEMLVQGGPWRGAAGGWVGVGGVDFRGFLGKRLYLQARGVGTQGVF
jgi:hypothetical protein